MYFAQFATPQFQLGQHEYAANTTLADTLIEEHLLAGSRQFAQKRTEFDESPITWNTQDAEQRAHIVAFGHA